MAIIRLGHITHARSGDKGAGANIGLIAFTPDAYEFLREALTAPMVERFFAHLNPGHVLRYEMPNLAALNFVLPQILSGGGSVSLRIDAQGKALGQALLELKLDVPDSIIQQARRSSDPA